MSKINSSNIFLIDGLGAILSTLFLVLLYYFEDFFGMPQKYLLIFIPIGILFSIYSLICYFLKPINWRIFLLMIAIANGIYCFITLFTVIQNINILTIFGKLYFLFELIIVATLVMIELRIAKK